VQPTDEHQDGTRNILARLERQGPQHAGKASGAGLRLALVGGSAMLVVGLIGVLVSLGQENLVSPPIPDEAASTQALAFVEPPRPRRKVPDIVTLDERDVSTVNTATKALPLPRLPKPAKAQPKLAPPAPAKAKPAKVAPVRSMVKIAVAAPPPAPAPALPLRAEPVLDTDIALLTALLSTAARHQVEAGEQEAAACAAAMAQSRKCLEKTAGRP
jgi:hypothetical protein